MAADTSDLAISLTDAIGTVHEVADFQYGLPRIVSLVPSITELLCDMGLASLLVGRTGFCIHPAAIVASIPKVGGTKDVNITKIQKLQPTHLIVNIDENEKPTIDTVAQNIPHIKVIVTHPLQPDDNLTLYRLLGRIFQANDAAERLCADFTHEYQALLRLLAKQPAISRRVLYCIWKDPWMTVSRQTYIAAMLDLIGWHQWQPATSARTEKRYPCFTWDDGMLANIDEILLSSEPYRFTQAHVGELKRLTGKPVRLVDGEMLSWYGSRAIAGLGYLRQLALATSDC